MTDADIGSLGSCSEKGPCTSPLITGARPSIASISNDLPELSGPSTAHCSPLRHVQSVLRKTAFSPNRRLTFSKLRNSFWQLGCDTIGVLQTLDSNIPLTAFSLPATLSRHVS